MSAIDWPPKFTLDAEQILKLLTGDRFYSAADAAIREAILNAIDAIGRRQFVEPDLPSDIKVLYDESAMTVTISDNGDGMGKTELGELFSKVGASASRIAQISGEDQYKAVGEFGIGIVSYFLVCDRYEVHTLQRDGEAIGLEFTRTMLDAETPAILKTPQRDTIGTTVVLSVRNEKLFHRLLERFPHWARDVQGLTAMKEPGSENIPQGGLSKQIRNIEVDKRDWIEAAHLGPPENFDVWDSLDGNGHIDVLYRGVFVDRIDVSHLWGIEGSLHVDPKHFKQKLNREGFVGEDLRNEIEPFLLSIHPKALEKAVECVREVLASEQTKDWTIFKWVTLWLSVPRSGAYTEAARLWDEEFRNRKAFRLLLPDDKTKEVSIADLLDKQDESIYLAPVNPANTLIRQAIRVLRAKGVTVVQGVIRESNYLSNASIVGQSTGDLLISHFRDLLPDLLRIDDIAEEIVSEEALDEIFDEPPKLRIVRLGLDAAALVAVKGDIWINIEADAGKRIIEEICARNEGHIGLWIATMKHAPNQAAEIAGVMKDKQFGPAPLGLVRRQYLRGLIK